MDGLRKPVYGEPARESRKGKTYVSKLKEEDRTRTKSDLQRLAVKQRLADIAARDRELAGDNEAFLAILDKIDAYVKIDYNAVQSGIIETENEAYEAILGQMRDFISGMIPKMNRRRQPSRKKTS